MTHPPRPAIGYGASVGPAEDESGSDEQECVPMSSMRGEIQSDGEPASGGAGHRPGRQRRGEMGFSVLEVLCAMVITGIGALGTLTAMTTTSVLDEEVREQARAIEAATAVLESIRSTDYGQDIANLEAYWRDPAHASFEVPGLNRAGTNWQAASAALPAIGTVSLDASDRERMRFIVRVNWASRGGDRGISRSIVATEVLR